jgi:hypothetical protein
MAHDQTVFEQYAKHSDVLRNWFVAYGIGGVVLFISSHEAFVNIQKSILSEIALWFILGVIAQVALAFVNKVYNFIMYQREEPARTRFAKNMIAFFVVDFPIDVFTIFSFAKATYILFTSLYK